LVPNTKRREVGVARTAKQAARTEGLFREVNERIAESALLSPVDGAHFVCECADPACTAAIHAPLETYEDVRAEPTLFIVKPGHADERVEEVVSEAGDYEVVEKDAPAAAEEARKLDPRS
jgi:hypothetical protein